MILSDSEIDEILEQYFGITDYDRYTTVITTVDTIVRALEFAFDTGVLEEFKSVFHPELKG
jgi:hypothetical protein